LSCATVISSEYYSRTYTSSMFDSAIWHRNMLEIRRKRGLGARGSQHPSRCFSQHRGLPKSDKSNPQFYNVGDFFASENRTVSHLPDIPLSHIPKLEYLDINTSFFVPEGHRLPAIQSMVLRDSYTLGVWLFAFLRELDAQGDLGSLPMVFRHIIAKVTNHSRFRMTSFARSSDSIKYCISSCQ